MSNSSDMSKLQNSGHGTLIAQVFSGGGAFPLQNASVTISNSDNSFTEAQFTDSSGRTQGTELPAPPFSASQSPDGPRPYSVYNMRVTHPGFYTESFLNIPVFDRTVSIQPVSMEPLGEDSTADERVIVIDEATGTQRR